MPQEGRFPVISLLSRHPQRPIRPQPPVLSLSSHPARVCQNTSRTRPFTGGANCWTNPRPNTGTPKCDGQNGIRDENDGQHRRRAGIRPHSARHLSTCLFLSSSSLQERKWKVTRLSMVSTKLQLLGAVLHCWPCAPEGLGGRRFSAEHLESGGACIYFERARRDGPASRMLTVLP